MPNSLRIAALCGLVAAPVLQGCLSLSATQSAQAIAPNQVQHAFGLEWFTVESDADEFPAPFALPFYAVRIGLSEGMDFGVRTNATLSNIGLDLKVQALDTEHVDIAVDPTVQYAWVWGWAHLPLLVGLSLGESVQLQMSGRIAYVLPLGTADGVFEELTSAFGTEDQAVAGGGLAIYLRVSDRLAIVPEVQAVRGFGDTDPLVVSFTVGLTFGDQPGVEPEPELPIVPPTAPGPVTPSPYPYAPPAGGYPIGPTAPPPSTPPPGPPPDTAPTLPPGYGGDAPGAIPPPPGAPPASDGPETDEEEDEEPTQREDEPAEPAAPDSPAGALTPPST